MLIKSTFCLGIFTEFSILDPILVTLSSLFIELIRIGRQIHRQRHSLIKDGKNDAYDEATCGPFMPQPFIDRPFSRSQSSISRSVLERPSFGGYPYCDGGNRVASLMRTVPSMKSRFAFEQLFVCLICRQLLPIRPCLNLNFITISISRRYLQSL